MDAVVAVSEACTVVLLHVCMLRKYEGAMATVMLVWGPGELWCYSCFRFCVYC